MVSAFVSTSVCQCVDPLSAYLLHVNFICLYAHLSLHLFFLSIYPSLKNRGIIFKALISVFPRAKSTKIIINF